MSLLVRFILVALVLSVIVVLGRAVVVFDRQKAEQAALRGDQALFWGRMVANVPPPERAAWIAALNRARSGTSVGRDADLVLIGSDGRPQSAQPSSPTADALLPPETLPRRPFEYRDHSEIANGLGSIALPGAPPQFLLVRSPGFQIAQAIWMQVAIPLFFIGLTVALIALVTFSYLRGRAREAERVLADMRTGLLSRRFAIRQEDAVGKLMLAFNRMADALEDTIRKLGSSEQARRKLVVELGHDLRTPLTSTLQLVEAMEDHPELSPSTRTKSLRLMRQELEYIHQLTENLLTVAEGDVDDFRPSFRDVDLGTLVAGEVEAMAATLRSVQKTLEIQKIVMSARHVQCDPELVRRALRNLLVNAVAFAANHIAVEVTNLEGTVAITVRDNGPGFSPQQLALARHGPIPASAPAYGRQGRGLGLSIVRRVAHLHGGEILFANGVRGGAEVTFTLELAGLHEAVPNDSEGRATLQ